MQPGIADREVVFPELIGWVLLHEVTIFFYALLPVCGVHVVHAPHEIALALGHAVHVLHGQFCVLFSILGLPKISCNRSHGGVGPGEIRIELHGARERLQRLIHFARSLLFHALGILVHRFEIANFKRSLGRGELH